MLGLCLAVALAATAGATCSDDRCPDQSAIDSVRSAIAKSCDCTNATSHKKYVRCAKAAIKDAVKGGTLPKQCKKAVGRCERATTCGMDDAAVCCTMDGKGRVKGRVTRKPDKCGGAVCTAFASTADSCMPDASCAPLVRPFRNIQTVFSQSCALPTCHSAVARQGELVLESEELSYESLVDKPAVQELAADMGLMRVKSGDPEDSFLMRKLHGLGPGDSMPQGLPPLSQNLIDMIGDWIARGAHSTAEECPALADGGEGGGAAGASVVVNAHAGNVRTVCDDAPVTGDYVWKPQDPLPPPAPGEGIQLYVPQRPVAPGTEWEVCYAFKPDWYAIADQIGIEDYGPTNPIMVKSQEYRMHDGSHHLLLYGYFGSDPDGWKLNEFFPCVAANCTNENPGDCPADAGTKLPMGGTQVAGTSYQVNYPEGVGLPILSPNSVIVANLHYTNPFSPPQDIYGEAWLNLNFYKPGEFKALLDGIFAINYQDLLVEPFEAKTMSRIWQPRSILTGQAVDAAVFQLFGHMHKRGTLFDIDFVRDGACSASGKLCGSDDDCACRPYQKSCVAGQTCVLGPNHEDTRVYHTTQWDNAPVQDFPKPYLHVDQDEGLRWTCTITNGIEGDDTRPPKKCHEGCNACGWNEGLGKCVFDREACVGYVDLPCATDDDCADGRQCLAIGCGSGEKQCARVYDVGEPMPLVFGELADDDMCNMFGYFLKQSDHPNLP